MTNHIDLADAARTPQSTVRLALYAVVLMAFLVRLNSIAFQSLWRDEVDAVRFALAPLPDVVKTFSQPGFNGPLYFLMLRGWIGLAGQSEFAIRFPSLVFGVISLALIYVTGSRLFSRPIGLVAATLLAVSGYHVWYSQEAKMYALITALALAAIYCLRRGLEDGGGLDDRRVRFWIGDFEADAAIFGSEYSFLLCLPANLVEFPTAQTMPAIRITAPIKATKKL
jgi:4-amino-4-deoxy-L-arabinose transferase-like glycosyltransferase